MVAQTSYPTLQEHLDQLARKTWNTKTRHDLLVLDGKGELVEFLSDVQDMASQKRRDQIKSLVLGAIP